MIMTKQRCKWCNDKNSIYVEYHDKEWGQSTFDDHLLFELLVLEPFQAGLSWEIVLNKRESFKKTFDNFDLNKIIHYKEDKILEILNNPKIIRSHKKIEATINNAKIFSEIQKEWNSFSNYIWHFTKNKVIYELNQTRSWLSDKIAKDLKSKGMQFIGTTIVYSYLQAIGIIYSHDKKCFLYKKG